MLEHSLLQNNRTELKFIIPNHCFITWGKKNTVSAMFTMSFSHCLVSDPCSAPVPTSHKSSCYWEKTWSQCLLASVPMLHSGRHPGNKEHYITLLEVVPISWTRSRRRKNKLCLCTVSHSMIWGTVLMWMY